MDESSKRSSNRGRNKCQHKHENIIHAAMEAFLSSSYTNTSMDTIAEAAGVSKQTLYSHFGGKEELFKVAIQACCEEQNLNAELFQSQASCEEVLLDFALGFSALISGDDAISSMRTVIAESEQYPEVARIFYMAGPEEIKALLSDYLHSQVEAGVLQIENMSFAVCQLIGMCKGELESRGLLNLDKSEFLAKNAHYQKQTVAAFMKMYGA